MDCFFHLPKAFYFNMTKFEEFDYKRPEIDDFQPAFEAALTRFKESKTLDIQAAAFEELK